MIWLFWAWAKKKKSTCLMLKITNTNIHTLVWYSSPDTPVKTLKHTNKHTKVEILSTANCFYYDERRKIKSSRSTREATDQNMEGYLGLMGGFVTHC